MQTATRAAAATVAASRRAVTGRDNLTENHTARAPSARSSRRAPPPARTACNRSLRISHISLRARRHRSGSALGYVQLRGVGRWMYASSAAYPTTPYPLRSAWPGTHPTPALGAGAAARLVWLHAGGRDGGAAFALAPLTGLPRPSALGAARRQPRPTPSPRRGGLAGVDEQALPAGEEEVSPRVHHGQKMQSLVCAAGGNSPHHTSVSSASPATAATQ